MADSDLPKPKLRWYRVTPDRVLIALLPMLGLLLLSERFRWFPFNEHKGWTVLIALAVVAAVLTLMLLWLVVALLLRLRFQFSLRSLLVLVVVVAIPCSWLAVKMQRARGQRETVEAVLNLGGRAGYDYQFYEWSAKPPGPAWPRELLGNDFFFDVAFVHLDGTQVTDAGLQHLRGLMQLKKLRLTCTQVTDAGLKHLKGLTQLWNLELDYTQVTDAGLQHVKGLTQLQYLDLVSTQVTDAGLEHLKVLTQLQHLTLGPGTRVTDEGVKKLQEALPDCEIRH